MERFLNLIELSELLGVSEATLRRRLRDDNFPKMRIGRQWRFKLSSVESYMRQQAWNVHQDERSAILKLRKQA